LIVGILGLISFSTIAQDNSASLDSLQLNNSDASSVSSAEISNDPSPEMDSLAKKKFMSGVELVVDYGKLMTLWTKFESKYEAGVNVRFFERIVLAGEFGYDELNPLKAYDNALYYTVKGSYARLGLDYYTSYDPKSFYYAGVRYGMSMFEDEGEFLIGSEYWEDFGEKFGSQDITATWAEIIIGTETYLKIGKKNPDNPRSKFLLGWKFRIRILMDFENREEPRIYSIPGYGRTFDKSVPALNFYIKYRFGN
jgi:hypothetical protein